MKKTARWGNGRKILTVDQTKRTATRTLFTEEILGKRISQVTSYWQQMVFSGRAVPPPQKATDREVLDYVKANPDAIGYVSRAASLKGVKVVAVTD